MSRNIPPHILNQISDELESMIDTADLQGASLDYIAGLETALALITGVSDARPEELLNAEA